MMKERLESLLSRISYKPGWEFEVHGSDRMSFRVRPPDTYGPTGAIVDIVLEVRVDDSMSDDEILDRLRIKILAFEDHECLEWFKLDGESYVNPHRDWQETWPYRIENRELAFLALEGLE
jgi:hypothetical protein